MNGHARAARQRRKHIALRCHTASRRWLDCEIGNRERDLSTFSSPSTQPDPRIYLHARSGLCTVFVRIRPPTRFTAWVTSFANEAAHPTDRDRCDDGSAITALPSDESLPRPPARARPCVCLSEGCQNERHELPEKHMWCAPRRCRTLTACWLSQEWLPGSWLRIFIHKHKAMSCYTGWTNWT